MITTEYNHFLALAHNFILCLHGIFVSTMLEICNYKVAIRRMMSSLQPMSNVNHITKEKQTVLELDSYAVSKKKMLTPNSEDTTQSFSFLSSVLLRYVSISNFVHSQDRTESQCLWRFLVPRGSSSLNFKFTGKFCTYWKKGVCRLSGTYWGAKAKVLK